MEHHPRLLQGIALSALTSVLLYGLALAVPTPTYPRFDPGADPSLAVSSSIKAPGARTLLRTGDPSIAQVTFGGGDASSVGTVKSSRSKIRYVMPAMLLAALTPLAIHHFGEPGDKSVTVQTKTPASAGSSLTDLGNGLLGGGGHGRDHNGSNNGNGDGGDCNNDDSSGDDGGDQVTDSGDNGGDHGDSGDTGGDCDNGGGGGGGNDSGSGGGGGSGGTNLPEPGTVPLLGAGLMMAIAFRSRRND